MIPLANWLWIKTLNKGITYIGADASQGCLIKDLHQCKWYPLVIDSEKSQLPKGITYIDADAWLSNLD